MIALKNTNKLVLPVVKWVGGKRQLLAEIRANLPVKIIKYYEPFVGGGAVLFNLQPQKACINDDNSELINLYNVIRNSPLKLIEDLKTYKNNEDFFYSIRELDRDKVVYSKLSEIRRASRLIYLNKTCYNGLFRVNSAGEFNTPYGKYKNPNIVNEITVRAVSNYLNDNDIVIMNKDYEEALFEVKKGDFVYFDPPYDPVSDSSSFTGYTKNGFDRDEQIRLKKVCDRLHKLGVKFLLSNSSTDFIRELYSNYKIVTVSAKRAINSNAHGRGEISEVLVKNYE